MSGRTFRFQQEPNREAQELHTAAATSRGCVVVHPSPNELQLDLDSYEALGVFEANKSIFKSLIVDVKRTASPSRKAGRFHVTVTLCRPVRDHYERIMLQALLGSDITREAISWAEAQQGVDLPCRLFEKAPT